MVKFSCIFIIIFIFRPDQYSTPGNHHRDSRLGEENKGHQLMMKMGKSQIGDGEW